MRLEHNAQSFRRTGHDDLDPTVDLAFVHGITLPQVDDPRRVGLEGVSRENGCSSRPEWIDILLETTRLPVPLGSSPLSVMVDASAPGTRITTTVTMPIGFATLTDRVRSAMKSSALCVAQ
jgi:hypothetical protein